MCVYIYTYILDSRNVTFFPERWYDDVPHKNQDFPVKKVPEEHRKHILADLEFALLPAFSVLALYAAWVIWLLVKIAKSRWQGPPNNLLQNQTAK